MKIRILAGFGIAFVLFVSLLFLPHIAVSILYMIACAFAICEITYAVMFSQSAVAIENYWVEIFMIIFSSAAVTLAFNNCLLGYIIILCALVDVGGFTAGKLLSSKAHRVKALKDISPNKSWEGYVAGTICSIGFGAVFYYLLEELLPTNALHFAFVAWLAAILGDLFESLLKRQLFIKDSADYIMRGNSKLLKIAEIPIRSHGGYLDRMDSFIFASVAYVFFNSFVP